MSLDDYKLDVKPADMDNIVLNLFKKDIGILRQGIEGKPIDDIDFDTVIEYISMLGQEAQSLQEGKRARDGFISYTIKPEEISSMFSKDSETVGDDELGIE